MKIQNGLVQEINHQTQASFAASNLTPSDTRKCFERILGVRHGHIRGIGCKPPTVVFMYDQEQLITQEPPQSQVIASLS